MTPSDKEKIVGVMKATASHVFLATCDEGTPFVRWVSPIVEDDLTIWVTTSANANKVRQTQTNPRVCLLFVEFPNGNTAAMVHGRAETVPDLATRKRVWSLAQFNLFEHFPAGPGSPDFAVLRVSPEKIRWRESWEGGDKVFELKG